jgi:hypothetical protein
MNLDDLMSVWRSQDAAPLHGVNETLLHLALRGEEAKLQKERRIERWTTYGASAGMVAGMAVFLGMMIGARDRNVMTAWDVAVAIGGGAAALCAGVAVYLSHRAQARREQRFGESLRDQINRRLAQLDDQATIARGTMVMVLLGGICPIAIVLMGLRVNQQSVSDNAFLFVGTMVWCVMAVAAGIWEIRRRSQRVDAPRKRELEALLKELDG